MIKRELEDLIVSRMFKKKIIIIYGPRQSGKTTIVKNILEQVDLPSIILNGDEYDIRDEFSNTNSAKLGRVIGNNKIVVIDEAQRISNIGLTLKIMVDNFPDVQIIATGSSSFELANIVSEPLTGRKLEYLILPFSFNELSRHYGYIEEKRCLEERLIFGNYPEIVVSPELREEYMHQLADSYLYKDIMIWNNIKKPEKLERLVKTLALQLGNEVSYNELGQITGLDNETVEKYINLLEKSFVIFRLGSYNRNLRTELKKSKKIYFYDNGLRNAVLNNFSPLQSRQDIGALWENYFISERKKLLSFRKVYALQYFWRTTSQQEIDYIEEKDEKLSAFEIKWNPAKRISFPRSFRNAYKTAEVFKINRDNYADFLEEIGDGGSQS
ncbi:ATP-binding protein [bacterium]|nr:ATP-binding protein [bacterium]